MIYDEVFQKKKSAPKFSFLRLRGLLNYKLLEFQKYIRIPHNQHRIALTLFTIVATYICYKMESSFDRIREKIKYTKSLKEEQVQR